jgi:hypothetical protein
VSGFPTGTPDEIELQLRWIDDAVRELLDGTTGE